MNGFWCRKIGMTQLFDESGVVVPATVLDMGRWVVTQVKSAEKDGYVAIQIGLVRKAHADVAFGAEWLKHKARYFSVLREVPAAANVEVRVGDAVDTASIVAPQATVCVSGVTIGKGFQGGVKRHNFAGGRGSHGDKLGRQPGSMGFMRSRGRVIKGWRMAGRMGGETCTLRGIRILALHPDQRALIVKGSLPGKSGALLFVSRQVAGE